MLVYLLGAWSRWNMFIETNAQNYKFDLVVNFLKTKMLY